MDSISKQNDRFNQNFLVGVVFRAKTKWSTHEGMNRRYELLHGLGHLWSYIKTETAFQYWKNLNFVIAFYNLYFLVRSSLVGAKRFVFARYLFKKPTFRPLVIVYPDTTLPNITLMLIYQSWIHSHIQVETHL